MRPVPGGGGKDSEVVVAEAHTTHGPFCLRGSQHWLWPACTWAGQAESAEQSLSPCVEQCVGWGSHLVQLTQEKRGTATCWTLGDEAHSPLLWCPRPPPRAVRNATGRAEVVGEQVPRG